MIPNVDLANLTASPMHAATLRRLATCSVGHAQWLAARSSHAARDLVVIVIARDEAPLALSVVSPTKAGEMLVREHLHARDLPDDAPERAAAELATGDARQELINGSMLGLTSVLSIVVRYDQHDDLATFAFEVIPFLDRSSVVGTA